MQEIQPKKKEDMSMDKGFRNMVKTAFVPIMIYYFVHQISAMVLLSLVSGLYPEQVQYSGSMLTMLAKMVVMMLGGVAVFAYYSKEKMMKEENCNSMESKEQLRVASAVVIAVAGALFSLVLNYLFAIIGLTESSTGYSQVAKEQFSYALAPALLFYGAVSPMVEELVFRGVVYNSLRRNLGISPAILGSALLFGAIHGNIVQMLYGTIMGIVMAVLYEKYGKLSAPIIFHGAANAAIYFCTYLF